MSNRSPLLRGSLLMAASAGVFLSAAPAFAETDAEAAAAAAPATEVAPVTIQGQRQRSQPDSPRYTAALVDTPRNVTVIPQQIIEATAATSLQDLLRTSPGITFGAGEGGQPLADRPFIRGQASGNNIFVDGVRDTGGQLREVFNLEQVEVIKGPDSAYSGRGSGGGSINLTSKRAHLGDLTTGSIGLGTDDYARVTLDTNHQFSDTSAGRLNLMYNSGNVPGRPDVVDFNHWGAAGSLAFGLGTDTRVYLGAYYFHTDDRPDYGIPLFTKALAIPRTASGILDVGRDAFYGLTARDFMETEAAAGTITVEHHVSEALDLRAVARTSRTFNDYIVTNPGDGGVAQFVAGEWWMKRGTKSRYNPNRTFALVADAYVEATTGAIGHSYDVGVELARERNSNAAYVIYTTAGSPCPAGFTNTVTTAGVGDCTRLFAPDPSDPWQGLAYRGPSSDNVTKTAGLYAFDTLSFGERWLLNLGLRRDSYGVDGTDRTATVVNGLITAVAVTPRSGDWSFTNYQAGLVFKPTENTSVYASYGTASTPPTVSGGDQNTGVGTGTGNLATVLLDPEESESTEIGAKATLMHNRLSLAAAAFRTVRKNAQIQTSPGVYEQAGEAQVRGIELTASGQITEGWTVFGGYTWQDSELTRGAYTNVNIGDPLANTPEHSFSLFTTYALNDRLTLGGGVYHVSDSFGGNQGGAGGGTNRIYAPAYTRVDAYAAYVLNDRVSLRLNVQNIGDEDYIARTNGVHHADYGPGRQAILTLVGRF